MILNEAIDEFIESDIMRCRLKCCCIRYFVFGCAAYIHTSHYIYSNATFDAQNHEIMSIFPHIQYPHQTMTYPLCVDFALLSSSCWIRVHAFADSHFRIKRCTMNAATVATICTINFSNINVVFVEVHLLAHS